MKATGEARAARRRTVRAKPSHRWTAALSAPVDVASLVFLRVAFGLLMAWEVYRYFALDRVRRYFIEPQFFFSYFGFDWVKPWPGSGMYWHFAAVGVLSLCVAAGLLYRVSAALLFLGLTYVFLLDQSLYLNHFYLICLLAFLLVFVPTHVSASGDVQLRRVRRRESVPALWLWLLRAQLGLVYFYGGIAKLNADWLRAKPIGSWLLERSDLPVLGVVLKQAWAPWFFAYGGLLFDLLVVPALLWRRTRAWAFALALLFHLTNSVVFHIGVFPWLMIAATTIFFAPDWPRKWLRWQPARERTPSEAVSNWALTACGVYLVFQLLVPLRHWLYPGNVNWTEEGHRFAWRMKLRDKEASGQFYVIDRATGHTRQVDPFTHLRDHQWREMISRPDMILQYAHFLADEARRTGVRDVEVRALVSASLNGRPSQLLIDPSVDLAAQPRTLAHVNWILPLKPPAAPR
jgi:vitamin K-dependent gamma-carboxylase